MLTRAELQRLRSLRDRSQRETLGLFVVEGRKVVGELLAAGYPFLELYATPDWGGPAPQGMRRISKSEMARASHFPSPSEILAVGPIARHELSPADLEHGLTLALDRVQDPGNVGTLLRVADWFGIERVVLSPGCADCYSQKTINASMGSFARLPIHTAALPEILRDIGIPVLGCTLDGDDVHALPRHDNAVIVIGSEGRGISAAVQQCLTRRVTIPRLGRAESLNAAVAAAVVCDNLRRTQNSPA